MRLKTRQEIYQWVSDELQEAVYEDELMKSAPEDYRKNHTSLTNHWRSLLILLDEYDLVRKLADDALARTPWHEPDIGHAKCRFCEVIPGEPHKPSCTWETYREYKQHIWPEGI